MKTKKSILAVAAMVAGLLITPSAQADDPDFLTIAVGAFDLNRQKDQGAEFWLEYRSDYKLWKFKPFVTLSGVSNGMTFLGAGILMDVYLGRRWVLTPSFAPT